MNLGRRQTAERVELISDRIAGVWSASSVHIQHVEAEAVALRGIADRVVLVADRGSPRIEARWYRGRSEPNIVDSLGVERGVAETQFSPVAAASGVGHEFDC